MQLTQVSGVLVSFLIQKTSANLVDSDVLAKQDTDIHVKHEPDHTELLKRLRYSWPEDYDRIKNSKLEVLTEYSVGYISNKHKKSAGFNNKIKSRDDKEADTSAQEMDPQSEFEYYRKFGYECYSRNGNTYYKPQETWYTKKQFMADSNIQEIVNKELYAYYKCTCEGGPTGRYTCIPDSVPCYAKDINNAFDVQEQWEWERPILLDEGRVLIHDTYLCTCEGGDTGRYVCQEKRQGCIDNVYNFQKYEINEMFNQTRVVSGHTVKYECTCNKGPSEEDRIIKCTMRHYCRYNGKFYMLGDEWDRYNKYTRKAEHRCKCMQNPKSEDSNLVRCAWIPQPEEDADQGQSLQSASQPAQPQMIMAERRIDPSIRRRQEQERMRMEQLEREQQAQEQARNEQLERQRQELEERERLEREQRERDRLAAAQQAAEKAAAEAERAAAEAAAAEKAAEEERRRQFEEDRALEAQFMAQYGDGQDYDGSYFASDDNSEYPEEEDYQDYSEENYN